MIKLVAELHSSLAESDAALRKTWAESIIENNVSLQDLFSLFQADEKTSQRFTWLIGDICEMDASIVEPCMPFLFSIRDTMPFNGMHRSVAKWLWLTNVPEEIEDEAIEQLYDWLDHPEACIASKHYAAKALTEMAIQQRTPLDRLISCVEKQHSQKTEAHRSRMKHLLQRLNRLASKA